LLPHPILAAFGGERPLWTQGDWIATEFRRRKMDLAAGLRNTIALISIPSRHLVGTFALPAGLTTAALKSSRAPPFRATAGLLRDTATSSTDKKASND
jgi:hypothetical protein